MRDKVKKAAGGRNQQKNDAVPDNNEKGPSVMKEDDELFPLKIQGAGVEPFEMQVHGFWLVQDAVMALLAREEVCPRSSLSLALAGATLDSLAELQSLKGLKPGSVLRLVEEPYSPHSARAHLGRVLELLRTSGPQDDLKEGRSPSILESLTHTADLGSANGKSLKRSLSNAKAEPINQDGPPPEYLLPGSTERPLMALLPNSSQPEGPVYLRDLSLSCWNPAPGHRKLQGDFLYITAVTLEGSRYDITSCPRGFYVNRSTEELFDPRPAQSSPVCHCFTDLLCHLSPAFKQALVTTKSRSQLPPAEVLPTPYPTLCWLGPSSISRTHKNSFSRLGIDEQAAAQAPDWNEELQAARDLPQGSLEERLWRERTLLQVNSAFVWASAQGAETVLDGFVDPINANTEEPAFLWRGLFMSQGTSSPALGGDRGRRAAQRLELGGVQAYSDLEGALQGLHTLPTATVDYRGVRLSAQGLAPGLEGTEQDQESSSAPSRGLLYGVNAGPQESAVRRQLLQLLAQSAKALSLQRHAVVAPDGHQVPLFTSVDAQGLVGGDGRFYLLDLVRSLPADANFCPEVEEAVPQIPAEGEGEGKEVSESCKQEQEGECVEGDDWLENYPSGTGLPKSFPHGFCRLRRELLRAFVQHKHSQFSQCVRVLMEEDGGFEECATASDARATKAVRAACKDVGSVSDIIFEMRFNPNVFSPGVSFPSCDSKATKLQKRLLREAAAFIITQQIPAFVEYCLQGNEVPMDGVSLKEALHHRGINLRYLGHVIKAIGQSEHSEHLRHIVRLVIGEIVVRSTRRVFNSFVQGVEVWSLSAAVSHFLCCLLVPQFSPTPVGEDAKKKSRRRGRVAGASESTSWSTLTGTMLWNLVCQDAAETYDVTDHLGPSPNHLTEHYGLQKLSLLREFCLKTGVQLRLRDYCLDNQSKAPIGPDDVLNIFPVVKHIHMPTVDASKAFQAAQSFIQKGLLDQAHERLKEASYLFGRVCDELHPEACHCLSLLARVTFVQGKAAEARGVQLKAVVISERVLGFDHPNTIQQYVLLAVYVYAGGENVLAQKCLLRARHLMLTVHGEDHPYMATLDSCLGLVLTGEQAGQFLQNALKINISFFGATDIHTALSQHLLSQWLCSKGDYRSAMSHEKDAFTAFSTMFGEENRQTRSSSEFLRTITQQAVRVERNLRQATADQTEQTVECLIPATDTILEQLVLVTGIRKNANSDRLTEFKKKFWEMKLAEATKKAKQINDRIISSKSKREGEQMSAKEAACLENGDTGRDCAAEDVSESQEEPPMQELSAKNYPMSAKEAACLENGDTGRDCAAEDVGESQEDVSESQEEPPMEELYAKNYPIVMVNGHIGEPSDQSPNEKNEGPSEEALKVALNGNTSEESTG